MAKRVVATFQVPVLNRNLRRASDWNAAAKADYFKKTEHLAIVKPWRRLGATWIDDYAARRKNVALCDDCARRYGNWYVRYEYFHDVVGWGTNCDGCREITRCNMYYPHEVIDKVVVRRLQKRY